MTYTIPEVGTIEITTIVLDLNGTLAVKGNIASGVKERLAKIRSLGIHVLLFTGDARGNATALCADLGIECKKAATGAEKEALFLELDVEKTAAIGNARIDIGTFKHAKLSVATLQSEGIHTGILPYVDVIVPSIHDALDLFIDEDTMKATMRT